MKTPPITPKERLYRIVEDGMCIGCGLCESVAGSESVRMKVVDSGYERPVIVGDLSQETVDAIYDVCPGTRLEGLPERLITRETSGDLIWGPHRRIVMAYAKDPDVRFKASTGGVLTALGQFLLESKRVDFILHVKAGGNSPTFGQPHLSFDGAAVLEGAGSRYGPAAPLRHIHDVLDRGQPFAFVGKPCDISALRNLARLDPRVDLLVKYWLTPVCGGFRPPDSMNEWLDETLSLKPDDVSGFRYRGYGCPGPTRVETKAGAVHEYRYTDFWGEDESQWTLPFRCKVCPDGIGEAADIAAADAWPGGSPDPKTEDDDPGTNAIIIRTEAGVELAEAAEAAGYLVIGEEKDPRFMDDVQPHQRKKKLAVRGRWDGLAAEGCVVPRSARLRLDALAEANGADNNQWQFDGTRRRVREGKAGEAPPTR